MDPVTRALQTIAAIERERIHAQEPSPAEMVLSRILSTSSPSSSEGRSWPTARSANSETTADVASLTDQVESTAPEATFARHREIRIDKRDRVVVAHTLEVTRHGIAIVTGALLLALVLCLGWIGELNFDFPKAYSAVAFAATHAITVDNKTVSIFKGLRDTQTKIARTSTIPKYMPGRSGVFKETKV